MSIFSIQAVGLILVWSTLTTHTSSFQATPNGNADRPPLSTNSGGLLDDQVSSAGVKTVASKTFRSTQASSKRAGDYQSALDDLLGHWIQPSQPAIGCLFAGPSFAPHLGSLVESVQERLGDQTQLLTVIGGGVVGDGREVEDSLGLSFIGGLLPENSSVHLFSLTDNSQDLSGYDMADNISNPNGVSVQEIRKPSHLMFADPYCHQIHALLDHTVGLVAGGISVASPNQPSLALGTKVLPPGSLIGATFTGNIGLEVVVTQGCRPVGSTYRVTGVDGPAVHELDSERAIDRLQQTIDQVMKNGGIESITVKCDDFLGGIHKATDLPPDSEAGHGKIPDYFILRQMTGFRPRSGAIMVCGPQIQPGDFFRFHVQSKEIALGDWQAILKRAQTERLFLGQQAGKALGAFQISCMGRGQSLFGIPNVDLRHVETLLPPNTPVAGLMANAEIGPVGIRMGVSENSKSVLHGFASVVAMLCDYSDSVTHQEIETSCLGNATGVDAWE